MEILKKRKRELIKQNKFGFNNATHRFGLKKEQAKVPGPGKYYN